MQFTPSTALVGALALISQTFASAKPIVSGYNGTYVPSPTGYRWPNGTYYNGTFSNSTNSTSAGSPVVTVWETVAPPPAYAVTPVPIASYTPGPKLQPAVHWDHPVDDINNLAPTNQSSLYYSSNGTADPAVEHMFASLNTTSQYQSVVLAHSSFVQSVSCADDGILVTFTNQEGFNFAANAWPDQGEDFVLVTYTDGCGESSDQRTFWLIDSLTYRNETNAIDAKVTREIAVEDAFHEVHMVWGKYQPGESATNTKRGLFDGLKSLNSDDKTITKTADINLSAPTNDASPWGGAALLFDMPGKVSVSNKSGSAVDTEFKIFCVNCGVKSHFVLMGEAAWQYIPPKVTKLTAEIDANIVANFHLGMVATATFDETKQKQLFNQAIPDLGFSVGGVFDAGVYVTVDAVANLNINAEGQALAGVTMTVPDFKATLDMTSENDGDKSKVTGFTPQWEKQFEVAGKIGAKATLALPVGLHLGIKIVKVFDKSIALVEQPSLSAEAQVAASFGGAAAPGVTCNDGVSYSVDAHNDVSLNLFDIKTFQIDHRDWNILSGCKQIPGLVSSSSSVVSSSTVSKPAPTQNSTVTTSHGGLSTGTGTPHFPGSNTTVPHGTGAHTTLPTVGSTGIPKYGNGGNSTVPHGSHGVTTHPIATGTGSIPHYGGSNATHTKPHGSAGISTHPIATGTGHSIPAYGGSNATHTTKPHGSAGISTHPEATATSHITPAYGGSGNTTSSVPLGTHSVSTRPEATTTSHSIPAYGGHNTTTAETTSKPTVTSSSASIPGYGHQSSSSSTHASETSTTASIPGYGHQSSSTASSTHPAVTSSSASVPGYGHESSTLSTSTKPAATSSTPEVPSYGHSSSSSSSTSAHPTTTSPPKYEQTSTSEHTTTTTTSSSSSTTSKVSTTTEAEHTTKTTAAAKTSKKSSPGYGDF